MRIAVLISVVVLIAGCAHRTENPPEQARTAPPSHTTSSTARPPAPPGPGAPISAVISWVDAGQPADAADYHSATRDGTSTDLGDDIAFTAAATRCVTDSQRARGTLTCLVALTDPPPRPPDIYTTWKGGWADFDGTGLEVGSAHGDPGPFVKGDGRQLPDGQTLSFADYACRADPAGLFCVNYAHQSAARFAPDGIEVFGCLRPVLPPPADIGRRFSC